MARSFLRWLENGYTCCIPLNFDVNGIAKSENDNICNENILVLPCYLLQPISYLRDSIAVDRANYSTRKTGSGSTAELEGFGVATALLWSCIF